MTNKQDEYRLQCQVVGWLQLQYPDVRYCANLGGVRVGIGLAVKLKRMGYSAGIPDLMIFKKSDRRCNFAPLMIEFKTPSGILSDKQKEWIKYLNDNDYPVEVCRTFEDAQKIINEYLQ
jgi:hypothetical protein